MEEGEDIVDGESTLANVGVSLVARRDDGESYSDINNDTQFIACSHMLCTEISYMTILCLHKQLQQID